MADVPEEYPPIGSRPAQYTRAVDDDHALLVGALIGMVMKAREQGFDYSAEFMDDSEGNHLAAFFVNAASGRYIVQVVKVLREE